jgi:hypothetical protein
MNQFVTAVVTIAFATAMLLGARTFVELRSARDAARPVQIAYQPL